MSVTIMQLKFQTRKFAPGGVCYCRCGAWRPATRGSALQGSRSLVVLQLIRYTLFRSRAWCACVGAIPQQTLQPDSASCPPRCARASSLPRRLPLRPCRRHQLPQAGRADRRQSTAQLMTGIQDRARECFCSEVTRVRSSLSLTPSPFVHAMAAPKKNSLANDLGRTGSAIAN